eukprot:6177052-Pleurochrysis_carterae.AAC.1
MFKLSEVSDVRRVWQDEHIRADWSLRRRGDVQSKICDSQHGEGKACALSEFIPERMQPFAKDDNGLLLAILFLLSTRPTSSDFHPYPLSLLPRHQCSCADAQVSAYISTQATLTPLAQPVAVEQVNIDDELYEQEDEENSFSELIYDEFVELVALTPSMFFRVVSRPLETVSRTSTLSLSARIRSNALYEHARPP